MHKKTYHIQIKGRVQGVGFRPFVFNLAQQFAMEGYVTNNENGVEIYVTTSQDIAQKFLKSILKNPPTVSEINGSSIEEISLQLFTSFQIKASTVSEIINIPLTPDFAVCEGCKTEISNPKNRRYKYPFTTCVHCGPRYAITTNFPFERENTSLVNFKMCTACKTEYKDPNDRRFHSQTNSCTDCGIQLQLTESEGKVITVNQNQIIEKTAALILEGNIVAIKNTNGYVLCCDATNEAVIDRLRNNKKRPNKPFAVLYANIQKVEEEYNVSPKEYEALTSTIAPIVILNNTTKTAIATTKIAPKLHQTGVLLPSSSLLYLLIENIGRPIVCTSGNIHGLPIISENKIAKKSLNTIANYFVHHNLDIQFPQDDSVVKFEEEVQHILRRSRGFAPNYLEDNTQIESGTLAMGAHLKSAFSLVPNAHIYVSQYFGNLDNYDVVTRYKKTLDQQLQVFSCKPKTILIDAHPAYQSSLLGAEVALKHKAEIHKIQHHKAHFASVLGEHNLFNSKEKILGVVWDGTGYGDDNAIWGGEFFVYKNNTIERVSHFEYYDWLANDKMAKEPRISLLSLLNSENRMLIRDKFTETEWNIYNKRLSSNSLKTSSVGRLFDAVASALELCDSNTFEAEAAMLLEACANDYKGNDCIDLLEFKNYNTIPSKLLIQIIIKAYKEDGVSKEFIAQSFIYTLAKSIVTLSRKHQTKMIACSGGVFQNAMLVSVLSKLCKSNQIVLKINCKLPANDENISFGQLMYHQNIKPNVFSNTRKNKEYRAPI